MLRLSAALNAGRALRAGRTLLSVAGIALGVALGFAVHLINRAAVEELAAGVRSLSGEADLEVRGGRTGFPEELYAQLVRLLILGAVNWAGTWYRLGGRLSLDRVAEDAARLFLSGPR